MSELMQAEMKRQGQKWPMVKLGDICDLQNGYAFKSSDYTVVSNTMSCRMSNIRPGGVFDIDYNARFLPDDFSEKYSQFLLKDGDVIIAMTDLADSPKILGVPTVVKTEGRNILLNQRVGKLEIKDKASVYFPYLKLALNYPSVRSVYKKFAGGGLQINLGKADLLSVEIPLPPLEEQKRIAAILDKADAIRRKRQQAIQLADEFLRSVFLDMFGDPVTNPKGWEVKPVGAICDCIVPGRDKPKSFTGSMPWITTNELNYLGLTTKKDDFIGLSAEEIAEVKAKVVPKGSVIMTCVGDLGVVSIAGDDMVINQQLHAFLSSDFVTPSFLSYALAWQKGYMVRMASSTTVPYMNKTVCNSVPIILPPISLQARFEKIVEKVAESKAVMAGASSADLFESISQRSFSGGL
ncbi:restriction endonuclease subunit S [Marinomonas sp.]|uniref:restriction endonuclease subunit S n=1 Tax=Marinomonas sp. TaxID=1904862 RepID=UPI003A8F0CB5